MNRLKKTGLGLIIVGIFSSCNALETKFCAKDCKDKASTENTSLDNDSIDMMKAITMNGDSMKVYFHLEEPLVCKMTRAEQAKHKEVLQKEIFSQVKKVDEIKTGYIFYFNYDEDFLMKMTDYVIAENNCCPFLTFDIKLHSKDDVMLKISGSSVEAKEMIKMVLIDGK